MLFDVGQPLSRKDANVDPSMRSAPHNGTPTSAAAARAIRPHIGTQEAMVLEVVKASQGMTREEIQNATGLDIPSVTARVNALVEKGVLTEPGETRPTSKGRAAKVVKAV